MMKLKSYNCRGLRKAELADIIVKCDVLLLQETWLAKQELELLNDLHEDYSGFGTAKCDYANGIITGRKSGGTAILWKTSLDSNICGIDLKYDWCSGIRIQSGDSATVVINVYLPYECRDNEDTYINDLAAVSNIIDEIDCTSVLVIGDWNADASKTNSWFHRYVTKFCQENGYIWSSGLHLPDNSFTYVSEAWGSTSWLDHCFATKDGNTIITSISVDYDCHLSDHFPLNINVCCDLAPKLEERCSNRTQKIDWAKASQRDIHRYTTRADVLLRDMQNMHHELVGCTDMNCHNRNHSEGIEGVTGMEEVAEMWRGHFSAVLNCLNNERVDVASYNLAYDAEENCIVSATEIERCIAKLKNGKSNGMDNVSSEHLKNCNPRLASMLALCFTKMFSHGYLPANMLSVRLVLIIKSKSELICSKDNYRPIAIASVLSKVLEFMILERIEMFVYTHENQFGFKKQHGTDTCIYVMKEIINIYQRLGSSVYLCFLDASKAFDRINHDTLFKKLVDRNVPAYIVRLGIAISKCLSNGEM